MNLEIPFDNSLKETFKDSKVLITGNTGFKGSWLSAWLSKLGANCKGFSDLIPTNPSHYELIKDSLEIDQVWGDIADFNHLQKVVETFKPDFIFHLAAQPLVRKSYQDPLSTFRINTIGMLNVLESIRISKNPIIGVLITSDKSYKNIGFVLPRSFMTAKQHSQLRNANYHPHFYCAEIWDLNDVDNLFNVPSCVLFFNPLNPLKETINLLLLQKH